MDPNPNDQSHISYPFSGPLDPKKDMVSKIKMQKNNASKPTQSESKSNQTKKDNIDSESQAVVVEKNLPKSKPYPFELPTIFDKDSKSTIEQKLELVEGYDSPWPYIIEGWRKEEKEWAEFRDDGRDDYTYEDYFSNNKEFDPRSDNKGFDLRSDEYYSDDNNSDDGWHDS